MYIMNDKSADSMLGRRIRGYRLEELLGHGSLTAVYRARTEELWQVPELIITILLVPNTLSERARSRFRARFLHEARRLALLRHHYLHPLYGYDEQDGLFYLLTPPVQGEALTQHLRWRKHWNVAEVLSLLVPLATVFDFLHSQGIRCQFFNPANVLIQSDQTVLLSGLGLPQLLSLKGLEKGRLDMASDEHLKSVTGTFLGIPEYLAPEVVRGAEADSRSDIYALGILLFELLSGNPPFTGKRYLEIAQKHVREPLPSLHKVAPDSPVALELVLNRALHRNPDHRFQTVKEFVSAYAYVVERINTSKNVNLTRTLGQIRALSMPELEKSIKQNENDFLLEGRDTMLFPEEAKHSEIVSQEIREVITEGIREKPIHPDTFTQEIQATIEAIRKDRGKEPIHPDTLTQEIQATIEAIRKDIRGVTLSSDTPTQENREVITEDIKLPDASLIPFSGNKPVPASKDTSATYGSVSRPEESGEEQVVVAPEMNDDMDKLEQTAKVTRVSAMASRLQMLKQQIDTQSVTHSTRPPRGGGKTDEQT
ncbi:MAG TPA: protein kinase [Ktedonobacteraceae bacterium]|jgi:serine/threonine protein kinase|nr:protein kinase [Ktedonobacteraceae bacterium]